MKWVFMGFLLIVLGISCRNADKDSIIRLVDEWKDKKILIPPHISLISYGDNLMQRDSICYKDYTVITYVDSLGCISCKLQLDKWKDFMYDVDSIAKDKISYLFIFHPKKRDKKELIDLLQRTRFIYPVYIDGNDSFNKLNHFPSDIMFQTFLLDKENKVIAIGNPIYNPKIKELYFNILAGKNNTLTSNNRLQTDVRLKQNFTDFGTFDWKQEQSVEFEIINTGNEYLTVDEITASCGCTKIEYSKEPVPPNKILTLKVKYQAEHPEHFNKTITLYCNAKNAPFNLRISGNAK